MKKELRKDAQERLDRLIDAAVELYASDGFEVPLEKVAERAGVSRPTLYRNFADREALTAAVLQVHLDELTSQIAQWEDRDDAFVLGLKMLAAKTVASGGLAKIVPVHRLAPSHGGVFRAAIETALAGPLARAKAAGLVRQDFAPPDMHLAILMLAGGGLDSYGDQVAASIDRATALLLGGVAPSLPIKKRGAIVA
jgi:AcrR family transcriptional regulator